MNSPQKQTPSNAGGSGMSAGGRQFHTHSATMEPLLQRLEGVRRSGDSARARCPSCGGRSCKLVVTQCADRVLLHCHGGCNAGDVLAAVGLCWSDIMPPRHWPLTRQEQREARQAMKQAAQLSALSELAFEAVIIRAAAAQIAAWCPLSVEDDERLMLAVKRIDHAALLFIDKERWTPSQTYTPARWAEISRKTVAALRRELEQAEQALGEAERALESFHKEQQHAKEAA